MAVFKCKMCGGALEIENNTSVAVCEYCGTKQTLPKLEDEKRANLYDRANHFRRSNEFDKAMGIYEQILNDDTTDSEAYWSLVLCRYGIEYVEDPTTHKRVPTVNRAQFTSIFADEDYKAALQYADSYQKEVYEAEAVAIDNIQKGILEISQKEEPFDVFICYKETDNNGRRTQDSVLANDLYHQLTQEGFKVFFARITLEDKLGSAYEPYIFAALNSAKVMVVLGTKPEFFTAVWVKNEWSRYLGLIKKGAKKVLIPAYRDMDPYDLPEEFSHLQAQDMSKLGFMQDLIRGIKKLTAVEERKVVEKQVVVNASGESAGTSALLKRVFLFLEDGDWDSADEYCEKVLDVDPECAQAYIGKMLAELKLRREVELASLEDISVLKKHPHYQKACRFADDNYRAVLEGYVTEILRRKEQAKKEAELRKQEEELRQKEYTYVRALDCIKSMNPNTKMYWEAYIRAAELLEQIPDYKDAEEKRKNYLSIAEEEKSKSLYKEAIACLENIDNLTLEQQREAYKKALGLFERISEYKDSKERIKEYSEQLLNLKSEMIYRMALEDENCSIKEESIQIEKLGFAIKEYEQIIGYKDAKERKEQCIEKIAYLEKEQKRKEKKGAILGIVITAVLGILLLCSSSIIQTIRYNSALKLLKAENYQEAYNAFVKLGDFKDSEEQAATIQYNSALRLLEEEKAYEAYCVFVKLKNFKDSKMQAEKIYNTVYEEAMELLENEEYTTASERFMEFAKYLYGQEEQEWIYWARYADANQLLADKRYDEAEDIFNALGDFQDSSIKAQEIEAERCLDQGSYHTAIALYKEIGATEKLKDAKYQLAMYYEEQGKYQEAIALYKEIGATEKLKDAKYQLAMYYEEQGKYQEAITLYEELGYEPKSIKLACKVAKEGSIVTYGSYPKNSTGEFQPITWVVVEKKRNKVLLVSEYALLFSKYNNKSGYCTWKESDLRSLLNNDFYNIAFEDKEYIVEEIHGNVTDKVFILSDVEMEEKMVQYGKAVYKTKPTEYVKKSMANIGNEEDWKFQGNYELWTRDITLYGEEPCLYISPEYGYITEVGPDSQDAWALVRPAIWITTE